MGMFEDMMGMGASSGFTGCPTGQCAMGHCIHNRLLGGLLGRLGGEPAQGAHYKNCEHGISSRTYCESCFKNDSFKGQTYDAEFEEVKERDKWWFQEQPKALLK